MKLTADWFVGSKMIKELYTDLQKGKNILYFNRGSGNGLFSCNEMYVPNTDLNGINFGNIFNEDDCGSITITILLAEQIKFVKHKLIK